MANILARVNITKAELYSHFVNKTELGHTVVDEVIVERIYSTFIQPLPFFEIHLNGFIELIRWSGSDLSIADIKFACSLTNLAQAMAPIDEGFRTRRVKIYEQWCQAIVIAMVRTKQVN